MKIVHLNYSDLDGGASKATYRIHECLLNKKKNSFIWVNHSISNNTRVYYKKGIFNKLLIKLRFFLSRLIVKLLKTKNTNLHSISFFSSDWIKRINKSDADIVHLHWIQKEMISIKDLSLLKKPVLWTLHDMWAFCGAEHIAKNNRWIKGYKKNNRPSSEKGFDLNLWTWKRKKRYWNKPIQIITPSEWLKKSVTKSCLMKNWPVKKIPNPINTKVWKPLQKKRARIIHSIPIDKPIFLFGAIGGTQDKNKGFDLLVSALEIIYKKKIIDDFNLVVFGEDSPKNKLYFDFPILFKGYFKEDINLSTLYSAADLMIAPSRVEAFGQTALEAQSCKVPVIAFDNSGVSEIIQHKKTGYLSKSYDLEDLVNGIIWVYKNRITHKLGTNARNNVKKKFDYSVVSEQYFKTYKEILKNKTQ